MERVKPHVQHNFKSKLLVRRGGRWDCVPGDCRGNRVWLARGGSPVAGRQRAATVTPSRFIVGYKDDEDAKVRYFGPFVSESVADFFTAALPEPLDGGWVRTVALQPFGPQEGRTVNQLIIRERKQPEVAVKSNVRRRPSHH